MSCTRKFASNIDLPYTVESSCVWFDVFVDSVVKNYAWIYILVNLMYTIYMHTQKGYYFFQQKSIKSYPHIAIILIHP